MSTLRKIVLVAVAAFSPVVAFAAPPNDALTQFIGKVTELILQPIVYLLFALAMYYFVIGIFTFVMKSDDPKARATGRQHMIWGVLGFFIMVSVITILQITTRTIFPEADVNAPFSGGNLPPR